MVITNFALPKNSNLLSHPAMFHPVGQPFIILPSVESSNNYAMQQAREGLACHGTAYFALEQTAGKGQRGKKWLAESHKSIALSVVMEPGFLPPHKNFLLSATVALATHDFFSRYAGPETRIKWPNDLYWRDRKAGGILIENLFRGDNWQYAIAGIGININQSRFDPVLTQAVSLQQITGRSFDVVELARELCGSLQLRLEKLKQDAAGVIADYEQVMYKNGEIVKLRKENIVFETTVQGITADGRLLTHDVTDRSFDFGEVEWVIA